MQVTLFANVSPQVNPYIALFQQAIQPYCQEPVRIIRSGFSLDWVLRHEAGQIAHLHWIENHLHPRPLVASETAFYHRLINKLGSNRISYPIRAAILLAQLALALFLANRKGIRVVYTVHNLAAHFSRNSYYATLDHLANRLILDQADALHVHSHHAMESLARLYGRTRNVFLIPHGNYVGCYPNTISRAEARVQLNLPNDAYVYLFLGQIARYKGLEELLNTFAALNDPTARLVIVGKVVRPEDKEFMAARTQHPRLHYRPGFVPEELLQVYFNAADVVVLPYRQITTSGSALLALSFGRPVVAPALGALPEIVTPAVGVLYSPGEAGGLTTALQQARHTSWTSEAVLSYVHQFDWTNIGAGLAEVYRVVLADPETSVLSRKVQV